MTSDTEQLQREVRRLRFQRMIREENLLIDLAGEARQDDPIN